MFVTSNHSHLKISTKKLIIKVSVWSETSRCSLYSIGLKFQDSKNFLEPSLYTCLANRDFFLFSVTVLGSCCELNYLLSKHSVRVNAAHWICCNNSWNSRKNVFSVCSPLVSIICSAVMKCCSLCLRWLYDQAKSSFVLFLSWFT